MGVFAGPDVNESGLVLALDASNKRSYSQNEFQNSTDIFAWYKSSSGNNSIISRDTISSPVGNTPLKMAVTGNDPHLGTYNSATWNVAPAANGQTWIVSVYVKASVTTTGEILIFGANSSGTGFVNGSWLSLTSSTVNIETEWTRVQHVHTMNNADVAYIQVRLDGPNSGGAEQTIWWDGLQIERVPSGTTTPTPFTSVYHGGSVYKNLVSSSNNGTLVSTPIYDNGSFKFDGVDDYISIPHTTTLDPSLTMTLSAWVKVTNFVANMSIFGKGDRLSGSGGYDFRIDSNSQLNLVKYFISDQRVNLSTTLNTNTWYNIVAVQSISQVDYYINGSNVGFYLNSTPYQKNTSEFAIARDRWNIYTPATISSINFYNRVLTATEVQQNFNAQRSRFGV